MISTVVKRYSNAMAAGYSWLASTLSGRPFVLGLPPAIGVELTNNCNLACPGCSTGSGLLSREKGFMDEGLFEKVMDEISSYLLTISLYFQGEPMLHPRFFSFLNRCRGIYSIVATNGHYIDDENAERLLSSGLRKLIISIDGADQETYSTYRINGRLEKVISGLEKLRTARLRQHSGLKVVIQFLVNRHNEHQIGEMKRIAGEYNATLKLKSMQLTGTLDPEEWIPADGQFSRYENRDGKYIIRNRLPDYCARLWFNPVITWDGKVIPCCFDKDAGHAMGDLKEDSFRDIWDGPRYRIFRKSILSGRAAIDICRNCTSGISGRVRKSI